MKKYTTDDARRQSRQTNVTPLVKPYEQAFMAALVDIEKTEQAPADTAVYEQVGTFAADLAALVETLVDNGIDGYHKAKKALMRNNKRFMYLASLPAPATTPGSDPDQEEIEDQRKQRYPDGRIGFKTLSLSDARRLPRPEYLIGGLLQKKTRSLLYGDSNTGKSFIALDAAICVAYGCEWQGRRVEQGNVLYVYGEGDSGLSLRIEAAMRKFEFETETDRLQFIPFPVQMRDEIDEMCATIDHMGGASLVIFDTFSVCSLGVEENNNAEVALCLESARLLTQKYNCHVMIIHHVGKSGDYRGATVFKGNVDTMIKVSSEDDETVEVKVEKQRDANKPTFYVQLALVDLGIDEDTYEPITSRVIMAADSTKRSKWVEQAQGEQVTMLKLLAEHPQVGVEAWKKLAAEAGISRRSFDDRKAYMLKNGIISEIDNGSGRAKSFAIKPEYMPSSDVEA